jgi:predicted DsbA family dithiol-disulfide isomerase
MVEANFAIYFDFRCPFVYNAAMVLAKARESKTVQLKIDWRPFSLAQANTDKGPKFKYWEQPEVIDGSDRTLLAFRAGLAAKQQGKEAFDSFFMTLIRARHKDNKDLKDPIVIEAAALVAGLDLVRFKKDLQDPNRLREVGESHTKAVEEFGVFGVPTFVFPDGKSAYLKMFVPPNDQVTEVVESLINIIGKFEHVGEIKRPQPPWPHAVI